MSSTLLRFLLAVLLLTGSSVRAQSPATVIRQIRTEYEAVNREIPTLRVVRRTFTDQSTEGTETVGYFARNGVCRKLTIAYLGEMGKRVQEAYLLSHGRVFVLETVTRYDKPFGKVVRKDQTRFYLTGKKLVRFVRGSKLVSVTSPDAREHTGSVLNDVQQYQALLRRPPQSAGVNP